MLFPNRSSLASLGKRDPELLLAIEAIGVRFKRPGVVDQDIQLEIKRKTERACQIVMMRLASGTVELSTIQTLCLLSMLEFTGKAVLPWVLTFISNISFHLSSGPYHSCRVLYQTCHIFDEKSQNKWLRVYKQLGNRA